nr:unnamed protein product [Spirometra erinaceieuropaei]
MADYWKSNPKKFCEICKCWLADNKISITNHETGMRHKANVQKKLNDLRKNCKESTEGKMREKISLINDMAFVGMMKDIERDPSLAKRYGVSLTDEKFANMKKKIDELEKSGVSSKPKAPPAPTTSRPPTQTVYEWKEVKTADGSIYYWNKKTGVTQWERPQTSIEPVDDSASVQREKQRLDQFLFNRLIELSESGHSGANEAVCQAFDAPLPSSTSEDVKDADSDDNAESPVEPAAPPSPKKSKIRVNLLGEWQPVLPEPPKPALKLDLPSETNVRKSKFERIKLCLPSVAKGKSANAQDVFAEKAELVARLAEVNETNIADAKHPAFEEKQLAVSASAQRAANLQQLKSCLESAGQSAATKPEPDAESSPAAPTLPTFKRKLKSGSRHTRTRAYDD